MSGQDEQEDASAARRGLKAKVALRLCNKATFAQLAAKYQLHPNQIYAWNKRVVDGAASDFLARRQKPLTAADWTRLDDALAAPRFGHSTAMKNRSSCWTARLGHPRAPGR
jgi:hypothetical protein